MRRKRTKMRIKNHPRSKRSMPTQTLMILTKMKTRKRAMRIMKTMVLMI
jgi:hypothetical protein